MFRKEVHLDRNCNTDVLWKFEYKKAHLEDEDIYQCFHFASLIISQPRTTNSCHANNYACCLQNHLPISLSFQPGVSPWEAGHTVFVPSHVGCNQTHHWTPKAYIWAHLPQRAGLLIPSCGDMIKAWIKR